MGLFNKSEFKYSIETSNDNSQGVFKIRVVVRSDDINISKTVQKEDDISIEEKPIDEIIADLVEKTYKNLKDKGFKVESDSPKKKDVKLFQVSKSEKGEMRQSSKLVDKSLLIE